jgi:hypothetical protein
MVPILDIAGLLVVDHTQAHLWKLRSISVMGVLFPPSYIRLRFARDAAIHNPPLLRGVNISVNFWANSFHFIYNLSVCGLPEMRPFIHLCCCQGGEYFCQFL